MRAGVDFPHQVAGEQTGLHMQHPAHGDLIAEQRVRRFLVQPPLEGADQSAPAGGEGVPLERRMRVTLSAFC
jgi:hypothetical protein